jgi:hypothetical protein
MFVHPTLYRFVLNWCFVIIKATHCRYPNKHSFIASYPNFSS